MPYFFPLLQRQVYLGPGVGNSLLTQFAEALNYLRHLGQRDTHEHQIVAYIGGAPAAVTAEGDVDRPGGERDDRRFNAQCVVTADLEVKSPPGEKTIPVSPIVWISPSLSVIHPCLCATRVPSGTPAWMRTPILFLTR